MLIRADKDENLKQALLGGELNLIACPECGKLFYYDENIIYFDISAELMALVSPKSDKKNFEKIKNKMRRDFKLLKDNLKSVDIDYEPFYLCGIEELKSMAEYETKITEESEVLSALSAQLGYKLAALKKSSARLKGYPFYIPVSDGQYNRDSALKAAKEILKINSSMRLLEVFVKDISSGAQLPPLL
jgi:hypothetical protein